MLTSVYKSNIKLSFVDFGISEKKGTLIVFLKLL